MRDVEIPDLQEMLSPSGFNLRLTVPKKHYSVQRNDSLQFITTPVFDKVTFND